MCSVGGYLTILGGSGAIDEEGFANSYEDVPKVHVSQTILFLIFQVTCPTPQKWVDVMSMKCGLI